MDVLPCDPVKARAARASKQGPFGLITAGCMVHYTGPGQRPVVAQVGFDRRVQKPEQVYLRELVVGTLPQSLDFGWVGEPGMVLVVNQAAKGSPSRVVLYVDSIPFAQAPAGEYIQFHPLLRSGSKLTVDSNNDDVPVTVYAFPG